MGEFNYKKFITENKLTYASREVASNKLNEGLDSLNLHELTEEEIADGYSIVKELNLNLDGDLNEGLKDFFKGVKSKLKGLKPKEQLLSVLFAKIKKGLPSGVDLKKLMANLSKWAKENKNNITDDSIEQYLSTLDDKQLTEKFAFGKNASQIGGWFLTALKTTAIIMAMMSPGEAQASVDDSSQNIDQIEASAEATGANLDGSSIDFSDAAKELDVSDEIQDAIGDDTTDQTVTSDGIDINFDTGQWEADTDKAAQQLADQIINDHPDLEKATLKYSSDISNTPGAQDDNPDGPDKTGLGDKRLDTSKEVAEKAIKILKDKLPNAQIDLEDGGTNVSDVESQGEVDSGSDEAKTQQKSSVKLTDVQDGDKTPEPTPEDPTPDSDIKPMTPQDIIAFYSKKPDFDSSKYLVIAFQLLPRIIGNGKVINNPEFERFAKHLTIAEKGETFNDKFVARRIDGEEGSLVKKAAKAKGTEKEEILDTIDTLRWIRNTKKSPSNIEKWIKRLDPDIKLGERGVFKHRWSKDIKNQGEAGRADVNPGAGRQAGPGKPGEEVGKNPTNMMESQSIYNEWISLLLEFNIAGYDESSAKNNLGLLTQLYSGIWPRKDGSYIEYDNEYLEDKYKASVDKFEKTFPTIGKKMAQYSKDQKDKKSDSKSTPTTSSPEQGQSGPPPLPVKKPGEKVKATKVDSPKVDTKPGEKDKATKIDAPKVDAKPGEKVKATKVDSPKGDYYQKGYWGNTKGGEGDPKAKAGDKEKSPTSPVDFDAKDKSKTPQSIKTLEKMGAKKDLTTALSRIDNRPELEGLIKSMITYITIDNDDKILALKTAKTRFTPLEDQPKYTSTSTDGAKINYNLKEQITRLIGLISEEETKERPDVEKSIKILDKYADLKSLLGRLSNREMAIEFILGVMKFVGDNLKAKSADIKTSLSNVTRDLEKEKDTPSNKLDKKGIENVKNQLTTETLIRRKIRSLIKEQVRRIFKEETVENPKPGELIPAKAKSAGKDALILTRPDGAPYAVAHPDITSLSKMFLNGKQDDAALCGWVQKKIKEPDFIEDLMESNLSLNEASEIDPKTIKPLNNCPLK